jgi:hypothetical protein
MEDSEIEQRLKDAQAAVTADEARRNRREMVKVAREHNWTKYRIAAVLGVKGPTVDAIFSSLDREARKQTG